MILLIDWMKILSLFRNLSKTKITITIIAFIAIFALAGFLFISYFIQSSAHPSHGGEAGGLNLNRLGIWKPYLNEWLMHPFLGAGIGRSVFGLFDANQTIPPDWLPIHSHNMPLGVLAEFGLIGAVLIGAKIVLVVIRVVRLFYSLPRDGRFQIGGIISGVSTIFVHSLFEEFSLTPVIMACAIVLITWLVSLEAEFAEKGYVTVSVIWFGAIAVMVSTIAYMYITPTKYLSAAAFSRGALDGDSAVNRAKLVERAIMEMPNSHLLMSQGSMFWMEAWEQNQDPDEIVRSEELVSAALEIERAESYQWMNRASINWAQGDIEDALSDVKQAISLAPREPVYYLNLGWYYESLGNHKEALQNYLSALEYSAQFSWASHPFWDQSEVRKTALADSGIQPIDQESYFQLEQFWEGYKNGNIELAQKLYTINKWQKSFGRPQLGVLHEGLLALHAGDSEKAFTLIKEFYERVYMPTRLSPLSDWKRFYYRTSGIWWPFVPGVLQLSQDFGQFELYEDISTELSQHLSAAEMCELEKEYRLAITGGQLWQEGVFIPGICD